MSIIQNGSTLQIVDVTAVHEKLPKGNWLLKFDDQKGQFYLTEKESFVLPEKIYGDHSIVERYIRSFKNNSEKNLGILLEGIKGTGKTITAQKFCIDIGLPVIMINKDWHGPEFVDFITNPKLGTCIIFIDEFEKVYDDSDKQKDLLSIMDGQYHTNLIFLLTVNKSITNEYLNNRLNRIKYKKTYGNLEESTVKEVIDDLLINKEHEDSIYEFFDIIGICTFDLLVNIIKEMNLFKQDALVCGKHLNLVPEKIWYDVIELYNGKMYECHGLFFTNGSGLDITRKEINYLPEEERYTSIWLDGPVDGSDTYVVERSDKRNKVITVNYRIDTNGKPNMREYKFILKPQVKENHIF